ncbi:MAG: carboxypeptidase-like regulatory domain-containing protein [Flavobacteriales bacterium]
MLNTTIKLILTSIIAIVCFTKGSCQTQTDSLIRNNNEVLKGSIFDANDKSSLPYTNIILLSKNKGVISNEVGHFSINISNCLETDTIRISYIGYQTQDLTIKDLKDSSVIYLKEDNLMLNNITVFGNVPDVKNIVRKVLENQEKNYGKTHYKKEIFLRKRYMNELEKINFDHKKSTISLLSETQIKMIEKGIPNKVFSYQDFLGNVYFLNNENDSSKLKIDPIKIIELDDKTNYSDLSKIEETFKEILTNTNDKEYWKIKSGIIGSKIEIVNHYESTANGEETDSLNNNKFTISIGNNKNELPDSLKKAKTNNSPYRIQKRSIKNLTRFVSFSNEKYWEFLHDTDKYEYELTGATVANGEEVYIIDFKPTKKGLFTGKMYIATSTYALVRIDYKYGKNRIGKDFNLFGVGYTEDKFNVSMYFEKNANRYQLKYCSKKEGAKMSFDRPMSLQKKKKRFLFDKKIEEIKIGMEVISRFESSYELLVLDESEISLKQFREFKPNKNIKIIHVDQFNEDLWKGYSIIEPTKQMKNYKKLN